MKYLIIVFLFALINMVCLGGTMDDLSNDQKHLEYGAKHTCVLPIVGIYGDSLNTPFRGSCVLIDRHYVLTAAHVVYGSITQHVIFDNKVHPCLIVAVHSKFDRKSIGKYDIAIAKLQKPIDLDFYPELYSGDDEKNKISSLAGYGCFGTFSKGASDKNYDNKKRAGSNKIDEVYKDTLVYSVKKGIRTELEFLISPGDSGGGLFIDNKLAGIHSYVSTEDGITDSNINDYGHSTRISVYKQWILDTKKLIENITEQNK